MRTVVWAYNKWWNVCAAGVLAVLSMFSTPDTPQAVRVIMAVIAVAYIVLFFLQHSDEKRGRTLPP